MQPARLRGFRLPVIAGMAAIIAYLGLSAGTAHALRPWVDEGWHGAPAWSLAFRGYMGTPSYVEPGLPAIDHYTYWIMPLYPVLQAVWYRLFHFSLASMRALSILCGLLGLLAWTAFFRRLTKDDMAAVLFMALMACDYISLTDVATGRPEAMGFAFQAAAFAAYLRWREANFRLAILTSQTLVVASGMTHPNAGMLSFLGVLWLTLYFDRRRIRASHFVIAAIPYLVGAAGWGAYIAQNPDAFRAQYGYQIAMRSHVLFSPWAALKNELVHRYLTNMGLGGHSPGSMGPHYLKALIFVAYIISIAGVLILPSLRRQTAGRVLLGLVAIYFCFYTFLEGTKASYYLIYFVYPLTALVVVFARWCWVERRVPLQMTGAALAALIMIQAGGAIYRIRRDAYHKEYLPAVAFLRARAHGGDLIIGSYELGFRVGFRDGFLDDHLLGLKTGKIADFILMEEIYAGRLETVRLKDPQEYAELRKRLSQYHVIYNEKNYTILALRANRQRSLDSMPATTHGG